MGTRHMLQSVVHVIFTEDGIPGWFGPEPVKDSEPLDLEELRCLISSEAPDSVLAACWQGILITHRKVGGTWVLRDSAKATPDSPDPGATLEPESPIVPPSEPEPSAADPAVDAAE
jgi:hypothetical protein